MLSHSEILRRINQVAVVPIVRTPTAETALAAVEALIEGGLECVEITMTVENALHAIEAVADRHGDRVLLGAGTVLDPETARACMLAGAQFFVMPTFNTKTVEMARRYSRPAFPGALTPTEILTAWEAGADAIKVFPCSALGGARYIKALKAPFPHIELFPTGGVNLETLSEFLAAGSFAVGVGSELVDTKAVAAGHYHVITERARRFREAVAAAQSKRTAP
ncbi:MAG TPA: bifunctional 4-hydroxy-2-oxoglutarate aldolase/2-dehydro-3-deoxy-phosphogluconate aldolase [Bryobacteraceae bacterium]|nr:bifunctional 4-hydroxy-2-oxoglutarate aldolase/2-dehydro-3-deoxy-phosphogluconate aldolase [Bryobacteraceae bacterium]